LLGRINNAKTYNLPGQPVFRIAEKLDSLFDKEWSKVTKSLAKIQERSGGGPTGIKLSFSAPKAAQAESSSPAPTAGATPKVSLKLRTSMSARPTPEQGSPAPAPAPAARPILKLKANAGGGDAATTTTPKKLKIDGSKKDKETVAAPVVPAVPVIPPLPDTPLVDLRQYESEPVNHKKAKAVLKQMNQSEYSFFFRAPVDATSAPGCVCPFVLPLIGSPPHFSCDDFGVQVL
jgi:hypothetical protein